MDLEGKNATRISFKLLDNKSLMILSLFPITSVLLHKHNQTYLILQCTWLVSGEHKLFYAAFLRNVVYNGRLCDYDMIPTRVNVEHTEISPFVRITHCSFFCCTHLTFQTQNLRKSKRDLTSARRMEKYQEIIIF